MNAISPWMSHVVDLLFFFLIWKELCLRFLYGKRQERLNHQLDEKRLEAQNNGK